MDRSRSVGRTQFVDAVRRMLSPAMIARGFGPGGPGFSGDGSVTFLYCTGAQDFAARWPKVADVLCAETDVHLDEPAWCLDFQVEATPTGEVVRLDFEGVDLDLLLRERGFDELAEWCSLDAIRDWGGADIAATIRGAVEALMPLGA